MKIILAIVLSVFLSLPVVAENYNNTGFSLSAEGEKYGISLGTGATTDFDDNAQVLGIHTNNRVINFGLEYVDNGDINDYRVTAGAERDLLALGTVNVYGAAEAHYTMGDSYTDNELRLSPYVGAETSVGTNLTPFVELGYDWKSIESDLFDINRADAYASVGTSIAVSDKASIMLRVNREMNTSWDATDTELSTGFIVKF